MMIRPAVSLLVMGAAMLAVFNGCAGRDGVDGRDEGFMAAKAVAVFTTVRTPGGQDRPCAIFMPGGSFDEQPKQPLAGLVFLHGSGECGADGVRSCAVGLVPAVVADPKPWSEFVLIVPQKPSSAETWEQHEDYVLACLERACLDFNLDRSRIYLTGLSQGGAGTWAIAAKHPGLFAAIAPVCGFVQGPGEKPTFGDDSRRREVTQPLAAAKMPVWAFHGEKDDVVPAEQCRLLVRAVNDAGWSDPAEVKATYFPEANHNSWDAAYRDNGAALAAWLLDRRKHAETSKP